MRGRGRRLALRAVVLQEVAVGALALRHGRRLQAAPRALAMGLRAAVVGRTGSSRRKFWWGR